MLRAGFSSRGETDDDVSQPDRPTRAVTSKIGMKEERGLGSGLASVMADDYTAMGMDGEARFHRSRRGGHALKPAQDLGTIHL